MTRFGVNYTPSRGWFHSWLDFRTDDARRDLEAVASLGVDHIRIFPLWPLVQPNRGLIRDRALADVVALVDVAAEHGLEVNVDLLQGRSEEHTSELQSLMRISYAVFCLKKKKKMHQKRQMPTS